MPTEPPYSRQDHARDDPVPPPEGRLAPAPAALPGESRRILRRARIGQRLPKPIRFWGTLLPLLLAAAGSVLLLVLWGPEHANPFIRIGILSVVGAGKLVITLGLGRPAETHGIWGLFWEWFGAPRGEVYSPWALAWLTVCGDMLLTVMILVNLRAISRLPWIGSRILVASARSQETLERNRWLRRLTFWGLIAFIAMPVVGSGVWGGTFLARFMGLSIPLTLGCMLVGSTMASALVAGGVVGVRENIQWLEAHPAIAAALGLALVGSIAFLNWWVTRKDPESTTPDED